MGINRREHQNQSPPEISGLSRSDFGVSEAELYKLWHVYYKARIVDQQTPAEAARIAMKNGSLDFSTIGYLVALSLELLTSEYFRKREGIDVGKPLDLSI